MKKLFISYCTEYDHFSGKKPDGMVISPNHIDIIAYITPYNTREKGDYECYWNYTPPEAIWCTDEDYDQMVFENGLMFGDSFKTMTFTFYKQLQ